MSRKQAEQVAAACERLRVSLTEKWLGEKADKPWQPCCDIVVHSSHRSFVCAVGRGPGQTSGCSTVRVEKGRILARRIDLRSDNRDPLTAALPHELTHVVLNDRFLDHPLPRWADEGIALLADSAAKQTAHERDLRTAISTGTRIRLAALVRMNEYPINQAAAFYAQSFSVVRVLVDRANEATFLDFMDRAMKQGYDIALQETYQIHSIDELERVWTKGALYGTAKKSETPHPQKSGSPAYVTVVSHSRSPRE
jgi:hypothetical protein